MKAYINRLLLIASIAILINSCVLSEIGTVIKKRTFSGVVLSKFHTETDCFGSIALKTNYKIDTVAALCYCKPNQALNFWEYVQAGDSVSKRKGSMFIAVFRDKHKRYFEYPVCIR